VLYVKLYSSFVSGYLRFYDLPRAHVAAAFMMGGLAFGLIGAVITLLAEEGIQWAEIAFEAMKDKHIAIPIAAFIVIAHVAASRYGLRARDIAVIDSGYRTVPIWPGALYTFGVLAIVIYASKSVG
jgi:hypothetical protein